MNRRTQIRGHKSRHVVFIGKDRLGYRPSWPFRPRCPNPRLSIVTGADARYFEWLQGTVLSVRAHPPTRQLSTLAVFDFGCTAEQRDWLNAHVDFVREPDWDFAFPGREQAPTYLKGLLARPHLRRYFPEFGVYLWLDADDACGVGRQCP